MSEPYGHDTISAPIRSASTFAPEPPRVIALRERDGGGRHALPLDRPRWTLGKGPICDLVIDDPYVSSVHCVLERRGTGELVIRDCNSKNGTIVDGHRVMAVELVPGAIVQLGRTYLVALGDGSPASALAQLRGSDPTFRAAIDLALRAARGDCSVLILGETGTGKDLVARAIHEASPRAGGPFVPINCGAFPRELIGAELFGHAKGAFTGAVEDRDGVVVHADGGTLFLDELGELELDLQPHLLRVIETKRVRPVGGTVERPVDVRFLAATNRVDGLGTVRSPIRFDLYHRLAAVVVEMPPLRARRDDILELATAFVDELAARHGPRELRPAAIEALVDHDWPGNVRELRQTMIRAVSLTDDVIDVHDLALTPLAPAWARGSNRALHAYDGGPEGLGKHELVLREMMAHALAKAGSIRSAAREMGMAKSTFADKARRFGLLRPRDRGDGPED